MYNLHAEWKPITNYPQYLISNNGSVFSLGKKKILTPKIRKQYYGVELYQPRKMLSIHRLVYEHFGKNWDETLTIDHINRNTHDNTIDNLRMATPQQQQYNQVGHNKLGVKGVHKHGNKYKAFIRIEGKGVYLGLFKTIEEAGEAYNERAKEIQGEFFCV